MTLRNQADLFKKELQFLYDEEEIEAIFQILVKHHFNYSKADLIFKKDNKLSVEEIEFISSVLQELKNGKPIQYIIGETEFYGLPFKVNPSVLIPRPETEELVEWVIASVEGFKLKVESKKSGSNIVNRNSEIVNILDIGTGSGCIAIALKKNLPNAQIFAIDIAQDSLILAQQNATLNEVEVKFIQQDILDYHLFKNQQAKFDVIVSNPPYITETEKLEMHQNVLANEPHRALFVSNEKPLIFYEAIADYALINLVDNGFLYFEINEYLSKQTIDLLTFKGFKNIELKKDMPGKDRMICCMK